MDYIRLGLFRIIIKILEVIYRLNLLARIKRYYNAKRFKGLDLKEGDKV